MKARLFAMILVFSVCTPAIAEIDWGTDYKRAVSQAKQSHKPLMVYLTENG